jgi:hypothetical protein
MAMTKKPYFCHLPKWERPKNPTFATCQNGDDQKTLLLPPAKMAMAKKPAFCHLPAASGAFWLTRQGRETEFTAWTKFSIPILSIL